MYTRCSECKYYETNVIDSSDYSDYDCYNMRSSRYKGDVSYDDYSCIWFEEDSEEIEENDGDEGCFTGDTNILTTKGEKKVIELTNDDEIIVFDHENGKVTSTKSFILSIEEGMFDLVRLQFDDGTVLKIIDHHGLFDLDLLRYVQIGKENVKKYINHRFIKIDKEVTEVKLISYDIEKTKEKAYSMASGYYYNHIANNMLCVTDRTEGLYNYFEVDNNLKIIASLKDDDINKYGLSEYDEWKDLLSKEEYEMFNMKYAKVAIGKGLCKMEDFIYYIKHYLRKEI